MINSLDLLKPGLYSLLRYLKIDFLIILLSNPLLYKIMKKFCSLLFLPVCVSTACALGLDDTYKNSDVYSTLAGGVASGVYDDPLANAGAGEIVTSPDVQLGLPQGDYVEVKNMNTSGLGTSQDAANVIGNLKKALDADADENDLMHWYVTAGAEVVYHTPNSFRCVYEKGTSVVMALWLPQNASTISLNFQTISKGMSISIWTYYYMTDTVLLHYEGNNVYSNPHSDEYNFSATYESASVNGAFTGHYLLVMFNTANKEKNYLDINGLGVSYSVEELAETYMIQPRMNVFQPEVGYNIVGYEDDGPLVPEPATATLSLLALAGLVARRRRK